MSEARRTMANVAKQAAYLSHRTRDVEEVSARVARGLADLRGRIEMARHAADSVKGPMRLLQIRTFLRNLPLYMCPTHSLHLNQTLNIIP